MHFTNWIKRSGFAMLATFVVASAGPAAAQAARELAQINPPVAVENDGKIEVLEFFAYGCIHCAQLEPRVAEWSAKLPADVKFRRVPAAFAIGGIDSAPIFYTLEAMGLIEKLHQKVFDAVNVERVMIGNPATFNKWLEKQGVDPKKFEETQRSFTVQTRIARGKKMSDDYKILTTPTMTVNGRYLLEGGYTGLFSNVDRLVAESRGGAKVATPGAPTISVTPAAAPAAAAAKKK